MEEAEALTVRVMEVVAPHCRWPERSNHTCRSSKRHPASLQTALGLTTKQVDSETYMRHVHPETLRAFFSPDTTPPPTHARCHQGLSKIIGFVIENVDHVKAFLVKHETVSGVSGNVTSQDTTDYTATSNAASTLLDMHKS